LFAHLGCWQRLCRRISVFLSFSACLNFCHPQCAVADQKDTRGLFNTRAVQRADAVKSGAKSRARLDPRRSSGDTSIQDAARVETADDVLFTAEQRERLRGEYRGLAYVSRVTGSFDFADLDESKTRSFTQKLIFFQVADSVTNFVKGSKLEEVYKEFVDKLKAASDATTVQVGQTGSGDLKLVRNHSSGQLIEFKLHASMKNGIEPQLKLTDAVRFRYDVLDNDALLEYRVDF
jgi:hypothetical protein